MSDTAMRDTATRNTTPSPRGTATIAFLVALLTTACASSPAPPANCPPASPTSASQPDAAGTPVAVDPRSAMDPTIAEPKAADPKATDAKAAERAINKVLDDWHAAAAAANEEAYFSAFTQDAIFLGTDATERWDLAAFRAFAHPHFAKGKAWSFRAIRRDVIIDGTYAWFDEDLATPNLGPSRGSGVLRLQNGSWKIAHYNLTLTIPNDALKSVKKAIEQQQAQAAAAKSK